MKHIVTGQVIAVSEHAAVVRCDLKRQCQQCAAASGCLTPLLEETSSRELSVPVSDAVLGEEMAIAIAFKPVLWSLLWMYGWPLLGLGGGGIFGQMILNSETWGMGLGLLGLGLGIGFAKQTLSKIAHQASWQLGKHTD